MPTAGTVVSEVRVADVGPEGVGGRLRSRGSPTPRPRRGCRPDPAVVDHARTSSFVSAAVAVASIPRARSASTNLPGEAAPGRSSTATDRRGRSTSRVRTSRQPSSSARMASSGATTQHPEPNNGSSASRGSRRWATILLSMTVFGPFSQPASRLPHSCVRGSGEASGLANTSIPGSVGSTNDKPVRGLSRTSLRHRVDRCRRSALCGRAGTTDPGASFGVRAPG
jgi:hypothetical protein